MFDGKAIRAARLAAGLKGKELAHCTGVTNVTISRIETGRQQPSTALAERIAEQVGVEVEALQRTEQRPQGVVAMPELSNEEREILENYRRLGRIDRAKVWAFVMGLASSGSSEGAEAASRLIAAAEAAQHTAEALAEKKVRRA